jgi:hypothetical protein
MAEGGGLVPPDVVAVAVLLGPETFPDASRARTWYAYAVDGARPLSAYVVPVPTVLAISANVPPGGPRYT